MKKPETPYKPGELVLSKDVIDKRDKKRTPVVITYFDQKTGKTTYITAERKR